MKKYYRVFIGFLLIFILVACSNEGGSEKTSQASDKRKEAAEETEKQAPDEGVTSIDDLEDRDYGGLTFTWAGPLLRDIDPQESIIKEKWANRIAELEEKWNFKFESKTIPHEDFVGNYIRTTLAGDPVGDIVYLHMPNFYPSFPDNGIAYPISDLNIIDFDDPKWVQASRRASEYKGKTYSAKPGTVELTVAKNGVWWNKTQFNNLGLPNLYELYENGEWTWDKMFEVAEMATKDLDNDGVKDVYGIASGNLPYDLIYSNGAEAVVKTDEGIDVDFNDPKIIEALSYFQKVHQDYAGVFLQPKEGEERIDSIGDFRDGRLVMLVADWWVSTSYLNGGQMKDEYGFVPFPLGPSFDHPSGVSSVGSDISLEIMLGTVDKPKEKIEIWDEITNVGTPDDWAEWKRSEYEKGAGDAESVEYALKLNDIAKVNVIFGYPELNKIASQLLNDIKLGTTTVQSGLEAVTPQIEAALAEIGKNGVELKYKTQEEVDAEAAEKAKEEESKE